MSLDEFYPVYLEAHKKRATKILHACGTMTGLAFIFLALLTEHYWFILGGIMTSYSIAWWSHFFIERNSPQTLRHPILSLRADLRLLKELFLGLQ